MAMAGLAAALPFAVAAKVFSHTLFARGALRSPILAVVAGVVATLAAALLLTRGGARSASALASASAP